MQVGGSVLLARYVLWEEEANALYSEQSTARARPGANRKRANAFASAYFAASTALTGAISGLELLRAPYSESELVRTCLRHSEPRPAEVPADPLGTDPIPDRLYKQEQLAQLARMSTTVECECPQHLAELLQGLSAFEQYSRECEDRSPQDALLHSYLHRTTAAARRSLEEALQHVVKTEGITLD